MSVTHMEHVLVLTDDLERTRDFYVGAVGLRDGERPPLAFRGCWLYAGAIPCLHVAERASYREHALELGLEVDASGSAAGRGGVDHVAFVATGYEEVLARLQRHGVPAVRNDVPGGGPRQLFVDDPNGVRVEISVREPRSREGGAVA
jgi:catechol 2,3-dioxygenase-like lactoylglutathione lyase family enzyme